MAMAWVEESVKIRELLEDPTPLSESNGRHANKQLEWSPAGDIHYCASDFGQGESLSGV